MVDASTDVGSHGARRWGIESATGAESMRVLLVAPQPFYRDRGTPIAIRQVLEALSELGHAVDLLTFPMGHTVVLPGLRTFRVRSPFPIRDMPIGFSFRKLVLDLRLVPLIRSRLRRDHYDAIHAVEEAAFPCSMLARRFEVPLIYDMQSSLPEQLELHPLFRGRWLQRSLRSLEARLVRRVDLVACSAGLGDHVRAIDPAAKVREWRFAAQRIEVDPADVKKLRVELNIPSAAPVVLYTGSFAPYQGMALLLKAARSVRGEVREVVFVLVGAEESEIRAPFAQMGELSRQPALRIVARQPRERVPLYIALADVLVSPRLHGGNVPLKVFDYLEAGKPIVATDTATHRTVLDESRAVLVASSASELASSITMVLRDHRQARLLGEAAKAWATENLGWDGFRDRVAQLYRDAARASKPSR